MRLKNLALGVLVCMGVVMARTSLADTLTLKSTSGQSVSGVEVYPYNLSLNGSTQTTEMMCLNYNDEITQGETWQVTSQQLSTSSSVQLKEDAFLYSQLYSKYSDSDVQFAVWDILDPGVGGNAGYSGDALAQQLVALAQSSVSGLTNSFLNQYTIYSPVTTAQAQASWTDGTPQSFIAQTSAVTPEPSSLLLLATGLGASALMMNKRRNLTQGRI